MITAPALMGEGALFDLLKRIVANFLADDPDGFPSLTTGKWWVVFFTNTAPRNPPYFHQYREHVLKGGRGWPF